MSRVTSLSGLYLIGNYLSSAITSSALAEEEYKRLRTKDNLLPCLKKLPISPFSLTITLLNVRSLKKHAIDINSDFDILDTDILLLSETQLFPNQHQNDLDEIKSFLRDFEIVFNNNVLSIVVTENVSSIRRPISL